MKSFEEIVEEIDLASGTSGLGLSQWAYKQLKRAWNDRGDDDGTAGLRTVEDAVSWLEALGKAYEQNVRFAREGVFVNSLAARVAGPTLLEAAREAKRLCMRADEA